MKTLKEHSLEFLEYCEIEKGLSQLTIRNYAFYLQRFLDYLKENNKEDLTPEKLSAKNIWDFRVYLSRYQNPVLKKGLKRNSQSYFLIALRVLLKYLARNDIKTLSADKIELPKKEARQIKFLSEDQVDKILNAPKADNISGLRDKAILETLFSTGLRVAELIALNTDQINFSSREIGVVGKGNKPRVVFLSDNAVMALQRYLNKRKDKEKALFVNYRGKIPEAGERRLSTRSVERLIKKYVLQAGIPISATPHTMRHSFATDLLMQGADLRSVQELLGHSNIATTQIYTHVTNKQLKDVHQAFHSGNKR
ncbi:hypothetical protein A2X44_01810 [candidate division CPR3 bacterium GWF2_35_18]|uniref:Tyrosine recombinase XerC n=1 Tax=candidate division CPR3 bacterium GW2011_GWF2_35_18 TaxID=1618350 RepID=A0A0G0C1H3_UNCC3|nr:MAG: Tyrosine recombinase XerC [candidate division CPR3 bacterium GW2011_GWF2_35_18]KKP86840.1 MAG: Tyrosine recombinase XerC [candidate division CPR3 bacterium GW2011_GWE2_35_7]OGB62735.1 MAG: hypothetical protein A2X44_01810 [candidate division CPR3 bacterium GWF2_35_18]OGB65761.1 MAG: hypothetical protein A2250_02070 [candidate division CPR3 bacterium RIFOXYA2_FULL_35_13]OGB75740.1 MAG: hypothetical protein A2476_04810 [candidate division CPR3 bacterium RIFOXYC2_FULL_35_7]OGB79246.1 MAG: